MDLVPTNQSGAAMPTNPTTADLEYVVVEALADAGFLPAADVVDCVSEFSFPLDARDVRCLNYFADAGWDAVRVEAKATTSWGSEYFVTLARWADGEIVLVHSSINGVEFDRATFSWSDRGVAWLTAAVAS
jgi:hypothetical protein